MKDRPLTAFEAGGRLYEFTRLPFGCTNAVSIFQRTIDKFIKNNNLKNAFAYVDDIIIAGRTKDEHDQNLKEFKQAAERTGIQLNHEKCKYGRTSISFLGLL